MASTDFNRMAREVAQLRIQVAELRQLVTQLSRFQSSFVKEEIIRREVQFFGRVRDASGAVVIN